MPRNRLLGRDGDSGFVTRQFSQTPKPFTYQLPPAGRSKKMGTVFGVKRIGMAAAFAGIYTCAFFGITNFFHWYFNRQFLYEELVIDQGYYMYDWVGNALGTVTMAAVIFTFEIARLFAARKAMPR